MLIDMLTLDPDLLRTFVAIAETGRFGMAAERVGRSQSAVSLQVKRLEDVTGQKLFEKAGRLMRLTEAGEKLLGYARQLLALNAEAMTALGAETLSGAIRFGMVQDFADSHLPSVLGRFAESHPAVRLDVRVARNVDLRAAFAKGELDVVLASGNVDTGHVRATIVRPMVWIGRPGMRFETNTPVPLALFEQACPFRDAALAALNREGRQFDVRYTSPSLAGIQAAVRAGLGVGVRTPATLAADLVEIGESQGLPTLGDMTFTLAVAENADASALALADAVKAVVTGADETGR